MGKNSIVQKKQLARYDHMVRKQAGVAARPYRVDGGYVNAINKYGTKKDVSENYVYQPEPLVSDDTLTTYYEGNGLFAKIIDSPAEEALRAGYKIEGISDDRIINYCKEALDELDWDEKAITGIKWARLFGGAIGVMLIDDGRGIDEPLDWRNIRSLEDIRIYERSVVQPDYHGMFQYNAKDPFKTRGSRLGMPEYYDVNSRWGHFRVHESRCLTFCNGKLPENTTNSVYQIWGQPEYMRLNKAIRDAELAHRNAPKLLEKSVQPVYKMRGLADELSTDEGEDRVIKRLEAIDMARGFMNSMVIDSEGEDYEFKSFSFTGINDVISASCSMVSAISNIPQPILFGAAIGGLSSTDDTAMENWYNFVGRIQKRMVKPNLRYVLSVLLQAGVRNGEIKRVPKINVSFNPLWSLSEAEQADLDAKKASTESTNAQTASVYMQSGVFKPEEVRKELAKGNQFDPESVLDELSEAELNQPVQQPGQAPDNAPAATNAPGDVSPQDQAKMAMQGKEEAKGDAEGGSVGVLVCVDGKILAGVRKHDTGRGLICGPGGHIEPGEDAKAAAIRETQEEFGITPTELIPLGHGPTEPEGGLTPALFLCTEYTGKIQTDDEEMQNAVFLDLDSIEKLRPSLFQPFADSIDILVNTLSFTEGEEQEENKQIHIDKEDVCDIITLRAFLCQFAEEVRNDGGPGSGNFNHGGRPGEVGGSSETVNRKSPSNVSATGKNKRCIGFANRREREKHWNDHGWQFPDCKNDYQYQSKALNFLQQECSGDVDGYVTEDGEICRFNKTTGEYAKGIPGGNLITYFIAKYDKGFPLDIEKANAYFDRYKKKEGIRNAK